jgi:AcrR family transcriptional regulator
MSRDSSLTRLQIIAAADELFYSRGFSSVGVEHIAAKAGITKKTLYYHFRSKDELIAAYLQARDRPSLERFQQWAGTSGPMVERMVRMFERLGRAIKSPAWKGCGFTRAVGELADSPDHPAVLVARNHKLNFERWLADGLKAEGRKDSVPLARALMVLVDGAVTQLLLHRDGAYAAAAAQAVRAILRA